MTRDLDEAERQVVVLALAELAAGRPGWAPMLAGIAEKFDAREMFGHLRKIAELGAWPAPYGGPVGDDD